eukprot:9849904-Alexandrium_andersonii.AAC.1
MSEVGEPVFAEDFDEDVDGDMMSLMDMMEAPAGSQEGLGGRRLPAAPAPKEAVDSARAPFAAGATPGE